MDENVEALQMTSDTTARRSRRAVLGAAAAAGLGAIAASLGRPTPADAGIDGDVILGSANAAGATTSIDAALSDSTVSIGNSGPGPTLSLTAAGGGPALLTGGSANLTSTSPVLFVNSNDGTAPLVTVLAEIAPAMLLSYPSFRAGLLVYGGTTPPTTLPTDVAVYASAADGFVGTGIGPSRGVVGIASGIGVTGSTDSGVGVQASASGASGTALSVSGKVKLSRSGRKSIGSTATSVKVTLAGVTTSSYVVATLQTSVSGCYVRAAVPSSGYFTVYLSKAPGKTVYVGYLVIN
jgi:hypothetical protein